MWVDTDGQRSASQPFSPVPFLTVVIVVAVVVVLLLTTRQGMEEGRTGGGSLSHESPTRQRDLKHKPKKKLPFFFFMLGHLIFLKH